MLPNSRYGNTYTLSTCCYRQLADHNIIMTDINKVFMRSCCFDHEASIFGTPFIHSISIRIQDLSHCTNDVGRPPSELRDCSPHS